MQRQHPQSKTKDHLVPQSRLLTGDYPRELQWRLLNSVHCCFSCNNRKGDMWPLEWLQVMPAAGLHRTVARLRELGCPAEDIEQAIFDRLQVLNKNC